MAMHRYACLVVCFAIGCSHGPKRRVLADKLDPWACAVDDRFVYVKSGEALSRVERQTGTIEFLTNDANYLADFIPIDGALYYLDSNGIHVWTPGATTRSTIAQYSLTERPNSFVRFKNRLCWGRSDKEIERKSQEEFNGDFQNLQSGVIECFELSTNKIEVWISPKGSSQRVATHGGRLYAALVGSEYRPPQELYTRTVVLDITDPATPIELFRRPGVYGGFAATPAGPVLVGEGKIWVSSDRAISLDVAGIRTIDSHVYGVHNEIPVRLDLEAGTKTPIPGAHDSVLCGDSKALYVRGARGELVEIPAANKG